jgi:hypothetical protein
MAEQADKTTHAQRRRRESQDAVRRKMRAAQFVRRLKELAVKADTAAAEKIPAMRLQADIYSRLLAKCLPDLKAIEHSGTVKRTDVTDKPLTDDEWTRQYATH